MLTTKFKSDSTLFLRLLVSVVVLCLTPVTFAQQPPPPSGAYDAAPYLGMPPNQVRSRADERASALEVALEHERTDLSTRDHQVWSIFFSSA